MHDFAEKQWNGKKWYCYGTSMTDNTSNTGWYSKYFAEYAGLEEHNFGKGGSGIVPALHGGDNIKTRCMRLSDGKAEADLITVEVIPNNMSAELGEATDTGDGTFCGNLNQIIGYLLANTGAFVAVLIATRGRYKHDDPSVKYPPDSEFAVKRTKWEKAVAEVCFAQGVPCWNGASEACIGYYRTEGNDTFVRDQIHLTDEGGKILANYFWGKLRNIYPFK